VDGGGDVGEHDRVVGGGGGLDVVVEQRGRRELELAVAVDEQHAGLEVGGAGAVGVVVIVGLEARGQAHPGDVEAQGLEARAGELGVPQVQARADGGAAAERLDRLAGVEVAVLLLQAEVGEAGDVDAEVHGGQHERLEGGEGGDPLRGVVVPALAQGHAQGRGRVAGGGDDRAEGRVGEQLELERGAVLVGDARGADQRVVVVLGDARGEAGAGQGELDPALRAGTETTSAAARASRSLVASFSSGGRPRPRRNDGRSTAARARVRVSVRVPWASARRGERRAQPSVIAGGLSGSAAGGRRPKVFQRGEVGSSRAVVASPRTWRLRHSTRRATGSGTGLDEALGELEDAVDVGPREQAGGGGFGELAAEVLEQVELAAAEVAGEGGAGVGPGQGLALGVVPGLRVGEGERRPGRVEGGDAGRLPVRAAARRARRAARTFSRWASSSNCLEPRVQLRVVAQRRVVGEGRRGAAGCSAVIEKWASSSRSFAS
jgi:hypothetical protein